MKVHYDEEVDALYLQLGDEKPDGVIEIAEGLNIDTILPYTLELDKDLLRKKIA